MVVSYDMPKHVLPVATKFTVAAGYCCAPHCDLPVSQSARAAVGSARIAATTEAAIVLWPAIDG